MGQVPRPRNGTDMSRPSVARVYDALLGGRNNLAPDREAAARLLDPETGWPGLDRLVRQNRLAVTRAAEWAARRGISQYLDLGSGLPPPPPFRPVWKTVAELVAGSCVVSVDSDPLVAAAAQALGDGCGTAAITGDIADVPAMLKEAGEYLDFTRPVCVMMMSVLSFWPAPECRRICRGYVSALAPGSVLVISCGHVSDPALAARILASYGPRPLHNHSREDVESFFAGTTLAGPGVIADRGERGQWRYLRDDDPLAVLTGAGVV